jgi:hypothetical protein
MNTGVRAIMGAAIWSAALAGAATPAAAQDGAAGRFGFTLNCRFDEAGSALSGACVDGATSDARVKGGKRHELTQGKVVGDHVTFSYDSSFMFKHFNVDYTGVLRGDKMSGTILANGQSGAFTATRGGG